MEVSLLYILLVWRELKGSDKYVECKLRPVHNVLVSVQKFSKLTFVDTVEERIILMN